MVDGLLEEDGIITNEELGALMSKNFQGMGAD
jgi:hypothetical protein